MTRAMSKTKRAKAGPTLVITPKEDAEQRRFAGSKFDDANRLVVRQATDAQWYGRTPSEEVRQFVFSGAVGALGDIAPKTGIEGMLAAQMVATHAAAMECFKRAMIPDQPADHREINLSQANKLVRSMAALVQTLDKHRGRGQQTVRVEHVHVYEGGQAIVGPVTHGAGALPTPVTRAIAEAAGVPVLAASAEPEPSSASIPRGDGKDQA